MEAMTEVLIVEGMVELLVRCTWDMVEVLMGYTWDMFEVLMG